ncbi:ash family protein [Salmonella enterica]
MIHQLFFIGAGGFSKVFLMFLNKPCLSQKTKATPKDRQCGNTKPVQDNYMSTISAMNADKEKALHLTICNQYAGGKVWCSLVAVYDHFSAVSMMRHAASNGAVCCLPFGVALPLSVRVTVISRVHNAPRRPSMVLLVGERSCSLAILLAGLPIPASNATSTAVKKHLRTYNGLGYVYPAPYKTGVGCESPKLYKATPDAESVFFCVCYTRHSMAWCVIRQRSYNRRSVALLAYHAAHNGAMCSNRCAGSYPLAPMSTSRRPVMVTLAGLPKGRPVPLYAGTLTPVNVTAPIECESLGGDSLNQYKENEMNASHPVESRAQR